MDTLLIILLALMTVAIPALAETAAAGHRTFARWMSLTPRGYLGCIDFFVVRSSDEADNAFPVTQIAG